MTSTPVSILSNFVHGPSPSMLSTSPSVLSSSSSLSESFPDVSSLASIPSPHPSPNQTPTPLESAKTNAFFGSPFSTRPPSPAPPARRAASSDSSSSSSTRVFTTSPPPSPNSLSIPTVPIEISPDQTKKILARLFPSRYNTDPYLSHPNTEAVPTRSNSAVEVPELTFFEDTEPTPKQSDIEHEPSSYLDLQPTPLPRVRSGTRISSSQNPSTQLTLVRSLGQGTFSSVWLAEDISDPPLSLAAARIRNQQKRGSKSIPGTKPISADMNIGSVYLRHGVIPGDGVEKQNGTSGRLVAVKMTPRVVGDEKRDCTRVSFIREVEILRHLCHPHIVPLLTSLSTPTHHILVLPYLPGGDLLSLVNSDTAHPELSESMFRAVVREMIAAVGWIHGVGVVHRDLKLENILLTTRFLLSPSSTPTASFPFIPTPLIKLTDFGLSRFIDVAHPLLTTRCGSEAYAAPELVVGSGPLGGEGWKGYDGRETDAWALGVVMYAVVCRGLPFGEGPGGGVDEGVGRGIRGEVKVGEGRRDLENGRMGRKHWLVRIAKGEWTWPDLGTDGEGEEGEGEGELTGTRLKESVGVRRVVEKLLVRDPKKRAKVMELWDDEWVNEKEKDGVDSGEEEEGWLVDEEWIDSIACQEVV